MVGEACAEGKEAPARTGKWKPYPRGYLLQYQVVGDLAEQVSAIEDGIDLVELGSLEIEVFFGTGDVCIVEVGAIEIVDPVHQAHVSHDEEIDLKDQTSLCFGGRRRAPCCDANLVKQRRHDHEEMQRMNCSTSSTGHRASIAEPGNTGCEQETSFERSANGPCPSFR